MWVIRNLFLRFAALSWALVVDCAFRVVVCSACGQLPAAIDKILFHSDTRTSKSDPPLRNLRSMSPISLRKEEFSLSDEDHSACELRGKIDGMDDSFD